MLHNALQTGHRNRWRPNATGLCSFGCDAREDAVHLFCDCRVSRRAWEAALDAFHRLTGRRWRLSPVFVVSGRPEDADTLAGAPDGEALRAVDILHACAIQAIWRLRCQVAIDGLPVPNSLVFSEHVLHLAEVQGLQLKQLDASRRSRF